MYTLLLHKSIAYRMRDLQLAYEDLEQKVKERTAELVESNLNLQAEILERKRIEREILEIPLQEQKRFGSQLHDGLCQELTAILMFVKSITQKIEKQKPVDMGELKKLEALLLDSINQARDTARGLYPGALESSSLIDSLKDLVFRVQAMSGVNCRFYCPTFIQINDSIATHLYRIAQEGITNAVKHGKAKNIEVSFIQEGRKIIFIVKDDGLGITNNPNHTNGIGLNIMIYRAHMMDATFQVEENVPQGVLLKFTFDNLLPEVRGV